MRAVGLRKIDVICRVKNHKAFRILSRVVNPTRCTKVYQCRVANVSLSEIGVISMDDPFSWVASMVFRRTGSDRLVDLCYTRVSNGSGGQSP